jgi:probable rRNA maturation factor
MNLDLGIIIEDSSWEAETELSKEKITKIVETTLAHLGYFNKATVEMAVMLTSNDHMQRLNKEFRDKNKPTNVLSFPDNQCTEQDLLESMNKKTYIYIGDIALGYQIAKEESEELGIEFVGHFTHLLVHGILHLLGHDHEIESEYIRMKDLEIKILKDLDISSPYNE